MLYEKSESGQPCWGRAVHDTYSTATASAGSLHAKGSSDCMLKRPLEAAVSQFQILAGVRGFLALGDTVRTVLGVHGLVPPSPPLLPLFLTGVVVAVAMAAAAGAAVTAVALAVAAAVAVTLWE